MKKKALIVSYKAQLMLPLATSALSASSCAGCPICVAARRPEDPNCQSQEVRELLESEGFEVVSLENFLNCNPRGDWPDAKTLHNQLWRLSEENRLVVILDANEWDTEIAGLSQLINLMDIPFIVLGDPNSELLEVVKGCLSLKNRKYCQIGHGICLGCALEMLDRFLDSLGKKESSSKFKRVDNEAMKQLVIYLPSNEGEKVVNNEAIDTLQAILQLNPRRSEDMKNGR
jgi:hypothetical protein